MKILITSGGTKVPIDDVRHIANMSSGRFGSEIAEAALKAGHEVIFLHAKNSHHPMKFMLDLSEAVTLHDMEGACEELIDGANDMMRFSSLYIHIPYNDFDHYLEQMKLLCLEEQPDMVISAAAVSDFGIEKQAGKIHSSDFLTLHLHPLFKIIGNVKEWSPKTFLVGFKMLIGVKETELRNAAMRQIVECHSDVVVANDLALIRKNNRTLHIYHEKKLGIEGPLDGDDGSLGRRLFVLLNKAYEVNKREYQ